MAAMAGSKLSAGPASPPGTPSQLLFDEKTRSYSISGTTGVRNARLGVEAGGTTLWAGQAVHSSWNMDRREAAFVFRAPALRWRVRFASSTDGQAWTVSSTLENLSGAPLRLGRCWLADTNHPTGEVLFGRRPEQAAVLITNGTGNPPWRSHSLKPSGHMQRRLSADTFSTEGVSAAEREALGLGRSATGRGPFISKTLTQWFTPGSGPALQFGFVSFDRAETVVESGWDEGRGAPIASAWTDFQGFELAPGATVDSEVLRIGLETDPHEALEAWADSVCERYHPPLWPKTPGGWLGWSWVDPLYVESYEEVVRRNIAAVRNRLKLNEDDIQYVWVSIGNLKGFLPGNWLEWNYDRFPSGPEKLAGLLDSFNFRWGLWTGIFWLSARITPRVDELRDAFLQYQGKPLIINHRDLGPMYALDPTHPKTQAYLREVYTTYRKWGVRYYMIDFLDAVSGSTPGTHPNDGYFDKTKINGPQAWREGWRVIREAAGDDTYLLGCVGTFENIGYSNGQRVGSDYGEGRALYGPNKGFYPGTFVINKPDFWTSHRTALLAMVYYFAHRKLYLADSGNVMTIDKPRPLADAQISATIFGINGGPVMLGDDIDRMDEDRLIMIRRIFPRLPECARPLDLFDAAELDYPRMFHLRVEREWDSWDLLAIFNLGAQTLSAKLALERLRLDASQRYTVWDFWNERFQGIATGAISADVPPDSVKLLRIARLRRHPWLLSTDLHVRQGQAEILACRWDEADSMLTLRAQRPAGDRGSIFVRAPYGWAAAKPKGLWLARDGRDNSLIVRCALAFEREPVELQIPFKRYMT